MANNIKRFFYCENVTQKYEGIPVVENIHIALEWGGCVSLVGPSGAGKTTLFNVLSGLDLPAAGKVFLDGEDITGIPGRTGYMPQKDLLFDHRTVIDNVILPLLIRGVKKKPAREQAAGFFPRFSLEGYEYKYPYQLSGGMRQRAALLRTYLSGGRVILLDEPFSALDAITRRGMREWYSEIAATMELSTLFITHDVDEAILLSDTVYILGGRPGKIIKEIQVSPPRPRDSGFQFTAPFSAQKQAVIQSIAGNGLE